MTCVSTNEAVILVPKIRWSSFSICSRPIIEFELLGWALKSLLKLGVDLVDFGVIVKLIAILQLILFSTEESLVLSGEPEVVLHSVIVIVIIPQQNGSLSTLGC
jgi:hypothetical protein